MQTAAIATRVSPEIKVQLTDIVEGYGLDVSSVLRAFAMQIVREKSIPLDLGRSRYNPDFVRDIQKAEEDYKNGDFVKFDSTKDMYDYFEVK
ncbi:MAG: type II toxin-antitoxin system RelB/DinJ family antitoxin [Candidatus Ancillula sp.]|jgi:addiction module RelB/DinJ family antitoxin|nr:type II toxin-antitoxin system RelB/DinJ family antitoxin [Candidatus Ancillula sp.]